MIAVFNSQLKILEFQQPALECWCRTILLAFRHALCCLYQQFRHFHFALGTINYVAMVCCQVYAGISTAEPGQSGNFTSQDQPELSCLPLRKPSFCRGARRTFLDHSCKPCLEPPEPASLEWVNSTTWWPLDVRASGEPKPGGSWDKNLWPRGVQQCKKGMLVKGGSEVRDGVNLCIHTLP